MRSKRPKFSFPRKAPIASPSLDDEAVESIDDDATEYDDEDRSGMVLVFPFSIRYFYVRLDLCDQQQAMVRKFGGWLFAMVVSYYDRMFGILLAGKIGFGLVVFYVNYAVMRINLSMRI